MTKELNFDHTPSLDYWAEIMADEMLDSGDHVDWDAAYESACMILDDEHNYNYAYNIKDDTQCTESLSMIWQGNFSAGTQPTISLKQSE